MPSHKSDLKSEELNPFSDFFTRLPTTYPESAAIAAESRQLFQKALAAAIQSRLNSFIPSIPQSSLAEKREAASWINGELRKLGLALRCPQTNNAAILVADFGGGDPEATSRFRFDSRDLNGHKIRSGFSKTISELELMVDPPRMEHLRDRRTGRGEGGTRPGH